MWIFSGAIVGLMLGLTGGGGSLLAVPLLVYVHLLSPQQAVGVSLATVGTTALWGAIRRWRQGLVDLRVGFLFSVAGMMGAPLGSWLAGLLSSHMLLTAFALLMVLVAVRMGWTARPSGVGEQELKTFQDASPATCQFGQAGRLALTSRCAIVLLWVGFLVGVLSGLFGVGGGFVIVPALVLLTGMAIHRAVATSLLIVALIGAAGFISHQIGGELPEALPLLMFIFGGIVGLEAGSWIGQRISAYRLQQLFSVVIVLVAVAMLWQTWTKA